MSIPPFGGIFGKPIRALPEPVPSLREAVP